MNHRHERVVQPLLTDYYQISMAYAYWKADKANDWAVFDLFFRTNPFSGEFTVFCGLQDCLDFLQEYYFTKEDIDYLRTVMPETTDPGFFEYLAQVNTKEIEFYAIQEGSVVFPRVPFIRVEGPLLVAQLLETTLLNLVNYASLVATNSARFRIAAGDSKQLLEFGLRRAQGPDGGLSASRYCYIGGFDATSNVLAGKRYGIPVKGTHAHAYINSFGEDEFEGKTKLLKTPDGSKEVDFIDLCNKWKTKLGKVITFYEDQLSGGEYIAFMAYALAFPTNFLCLIDTYDVLKSGLPNFCIIALALYECGYIPLGVRIDSGDLAYLSVMTRQCFRSIASAFNLPFFSHLAIVASNDINEDTLHSLNQQGHEVDTFGIGTHLVTCQKQPALGCVYKLVEIKGRPTIKLSEDIKKMTIPGRKDVYRLYSREGYPLIDYMQRPTEDPPEEGKRLLCRHPFQPSKRAYIQPYRVKPLYKLYWKDGKIQYDIPTMLETRSHTLDSLRHLRVDHKRFLNPTPYKVSVSDSLYNFTQELWLKSAPIGELL